ncbi:MAG: cysteine methyltransferase [Gammaproteobacteria bacterium]|nr:cysteine methyltransferase [Gammaproteobacteria bacterium]
METSRQRAERILTAVATIPAGSVASYGEVAARAGLPRGARLVGRALAGCGTEVPWHRVINSAGRISLPPGSRGFREQVRRLREEGVTVIDGRVPPRYFGCRNADLDELLWGPPPARKRKAGR